MVNWWGCSLGYRSLFFRSCLRFVVCVGGYRISVHAFPSLSTPFFRFEGGGAKSCRCCSWKVYRVSCIVYLPCKHACMEGKGYRRRSIGILYLRILHQYPPLVTRKPPHADTERKRKEKNSDVSRREAESNFPRMYVCNRAVLCCAVLERKPCSTHTPLHPNHHKHTYNQSEISFTTCMCSSTLNTSLDVSPLRYMYIYIYMYIHKVNQGTALDCS